MKVRYTPINSSTVVFRNLSLVSLYIYRQLLPDQLVIRRDTVQLSQPDHLELMGTHRELERKQYCWGGADVHHHSLGVVDGHFVLCPRL